MPATVWHEGLQGEWHGLVPGSIEETTQLFFLVVDERHRIQPKYVSNQAPLDRVARERALEVHKHHKQQEPGLYLAGFNKSLELSFLTYSPAQNKERVWDVLTVRWRPSKGTVHVNVNGFIQEVDMPTSSDLIRSWDPTFPLTPEAAKAAPANSNGYPVRIPAWCRTRGTEFDWAPASSFWTALSQLPFQSKKLALPQAVEVVESDLDLV